MAIVGFRQPQLKDFMENSITPKNAPWRSVSKIAFRKLAMLHYATGLHDLRVPPGNNLEALKKVTC